MDLVTDALLLLVALSLALVVRNLKRIETKMTALSDGIAALAADDTTLNTEVDALIGTVQGIPAVVSAAVSAALLNAGVGSTTALDAVNAVDAAVKAETAKALAALPPASTGGGATGATGAAGPPALLVSPLAISSAVGAPITQSLSTSGGTGAYTYVSSLADVSVDASGNVSGTPAAAETGTITVTDAGTPVQTVTVNVSIS